MSAENVEALRWLYAQFAEGKVWATGELLAPDVVSSWPDPGGRVVCHGQDELREMFRALLVHWGCYRAEARSFETLTEDSVLVVAQQYGRAERSGIEVESPVFTVWTFSDGRVVGQHWALNREEALEAAGIRDVAAQGDIDRVERVKELFQIWNAGDLDRWLETLAPDAVFNPDASWPEQGPFTGEAIGRFMRSYLDAWEHAEVALDDVEVRGEVVLVRCRWIIRGATSGIDLPTAFSLVFRIDQEGRVRRIDAFFDEAEARRYARSASGAVGIGPE